MKKVVLTSLLSLLCVGPAVSLGFAQAAPAGGQIQMSQEEYAAYHNAETQTTPAAKAAAFAAYLKAYPKSAVKLDVLNQMLYNYSQAGDQADTLSTADELLQLDPNNVRAITLEVYYRRQDADKMTDETAKIAALDQVAKYAQEGLNATKPAAMSQADFDKLKAATQPTFESAIADDDIAKKDNAAAITALKAEIDANQNMTTQPSPVLQDVYTLANAYYTSTPPDYLNCAWYATRAAAFAPAAYKPQIEPLAKYCYQKFHGTMDGYDAMQTAVQSNLNPPPSCPPPPPPGTTPPPAKPCLTVTPAPKPADIVANLVATTPDLTTLAPGDREYVLENGSAVDPKTQQTYATEAFNAVKGKVAKFPDVQVISATPDKVDVAVSQDAIQANPKVADFEFDMKTPLRASEVPAAGTNVTLVGTYSSYTLNPMLIVMSDSELVVPHKEVHHTTRRR